MEKVRTRHFDDEQTKVFLKEAIKPATSVPFIGTGFTGGERAAGRSVPFGADWLTVMREQIESSSSDRKPAKNDLEKLGFQDVSDLYFAWEIVPAQTIKDTLNACFSNVRLQSKTKQEFLQFPWPYLYTLNLDDAIEKSIDAVKVLPYRPFARMSGRRYVYKLHGDVEDMLAAPTAKEMSAIFGLKQYVGSLERNEAMLADLANDFAEKNLLFVGCSLTNELDILFSLARAESSNGGGGLRIFVTGKEPSTFSELKKMVDYGITDVVVVPDYPSFYGFVAHLSSEQEEEGGPLKAFAFKEAPRTTPSPERRVRFLLQANWKGDPSRVSQTREVEPRVLSALQAEPIVAVWGRRFSGRTTLLYRVLNAYRVRQRYLIPSEASVSDALLNATLRVKDAVVAIDANALYPDQLRRIATSEARLSENRTTLLLALSRADLNAFGRDFDYEKKVFNLDHKLTSSEAKQVNSFISPLGYPKWRLGRTILDNVFDLIQSPITSRFLRGNTSLSERVVLASRSWKPDTAGQLHFMVLYYLAVKHKMFSKSVRALAKHRGVAFMGTVLLDEMSKRWQPFVESETADPASRLAENSERLLVSNSFAWLRVLLSTISEQAGPALSAQMVTQLFAAMHKVDRDAFELVMYDSLNAIYDVPRSGGSDWRGAVIRSVYEGLAPTLSDEPDYWLQRAKSDYYISSDPDELRIAAAYCDKGMMEKRQKTWSNAKLTKANILGKLCLLSGYASDEDMLAALEAYKVAVGQSYLNPAYIEELLKKSKDGAHYMSRLCHAASSRPSLLIARETIRELTSYLN